MIRPRKTSADAETFTLCSTTHGTALRCSCCGCVEVTFGNAVLSLGLPDIESVLQIIESFDVDSAPDLVPGRREFLIRTQHDDAAFVFNKAEVIELRELLTGARAGMRKMEAPLTIASRGSRASHTLN